MHYCGCFKTDAPDKITPYFLQVNVLIVGAGPTGLGAATRLHQHGRSDWLMIDQVCLGNRLRGRGRGNHQVISSRTKRALQHMVDL